MHGHYNFVYVLRLPLKNIPKLIVGALDVKNERIAWDLWCARYPFMQLGLMKFVSFNEFKQLPEKTELSHKPVEEIEAEMSKVIDFYEAKKAKEK